MQKFWLGVVSKEHVEKGVEWGICQVCHGKAAPLKRMKKGDYLLYYSPKYSLNGAKKLQAFTAIGKMKDDEVYQVEQCPGFTPYRKDVEYYPAVRDCPLENVRNHPDWKIYASQIRYGHLEISKDFFMYVFNQMRTDRAVEE